MRVCSRQSISELVTSNASTDLCTSPIQPAIPEPFARTTTVVKLTDSSVGYGAEPNDSTLNGVADRYV